MSKFILAGEKVINLEMVQYFELIQTSNHNYYIKFIFDNDAYIEDVDGGGKLMIQYDNREEAKMEYNNLLAMLKINLDFESDL